MFKKLLLGVVVGVVLLQAAPQNVQAEPKVIISFGPKPIYPYPYYPGPAYYPAPLPVVKTYSVLYRASVLEPWRVYSTYVDHKYAHQVAAALGTYGYQTHVTHY
jgi:hypothetical protein